MFKLKKMPLPKKDDKKTEPAGFIDKISHSPLGQSARVLALGASLLVGVGKAEAQDANPALESRIENVQAFNREDFQKFISEHRDLGPLLAGVFYMEQPDAKQSRAILDLIESITAKIKAQKFNSLNEEISFINRELDSNFQSSFNTINLKDAFAKEGEEIPHGTFDCDSRSVMIETILFKTGLTDREVGMCLSEGHMVLDNKVEGNFFETNTNQPFTPTGPDKDKAVPMNSGNKYIAYLLGNKATDVFYNEGNANKAKGLLEAAKSLDSDNITNDLNYIKVLKRLGTYGKEFQAAQEYEELVIKLINKRPQKAGRDKLGMSEKPTPRPEQYQNFFEIPKSELVLLIKSDEDLKNKIFDWALILESNENYRTAIAVFEALQSGADGRIDRITYAKALSDLYLLTKDYNRCVKTAEKLMKDINDCLRDSEESRGIENELKKDWDVTQANWLASRIISGQVRVNKGFLRTYGHTGLLGPFLDGSQNWNVKYANVVETLKAWSGYDDFLKKIEQLKAKK
jgi:tetratricopeptide (TPR) repeat protein